MRPGGDPELADHLVRDLPSFLRPGDAIVLNDTKVIPARLFGYRERAGARVQIESLLHRRVDESRWLAFARPGRRLAPGDRLRFGGGDNNACLLGALEATVEEKRDGDVLIAFDLSGPVLDEAINSLGEMPLPPYIAAARPADATDRTSYQTIYAREEGAVAAPTAGLHFTDELFSRLAAMGVSRHFVTLHVGAGTFQPLKEEGLSADRLHVETGEILPETAAALNAIRRAGGRILAVGTTTLRLLESAADEKGGFHPFAGETDIFIKPGHRFRAADLLMTNFHLPKSSLFVLVSAFSGLGVMRRAYEHAVNGGFRFYSYGDACLLEPATPR